MHRPRLRYSLMALMSLVASVAIIIGILKAVEREQARRALGRERLRAVQKVYA